MASCYLQGVKLFPSKWAHNVPSAEQCQLLGAYKSKGGPAVQCRSYGWQGLLVGEKIWPHCFLPSSQALCSGVPHEDDYGGRGPSIAAWESTCYWRTWSPQACSSLSQLFFFLKSTQNQLKKHRCLLSALSSCWKTMSGWCKSGHLSRQAHASSICLSPHKGRIGAEAFAITNPFSSNNNFVLMTAVQSNLGRAVVTADCLEEQQMLCPGLGNHESAAKGSVTSAWIHLA